MNKMKVMGAIGIIIYYSTVLMPIQAKPLLLNVSPYAGILSNKVPAQRSNGYLKDHNALYGLFTQILKPKVWQSNMFIYYGDNINHSTLAGFTLNGDYTLKNNIFMGIGLAYTYINTKFTTPAGPGLSMTIHNNPSVYDPFIRGGYAFRFSHNNFHYKILPWAGYLYENIQLHAKLTTNPPHVIGIPVYDVNYTDEFHFAYAGLNLQMTYLQAMLKIKYAGRYRLNSLITHPEFNYKNKKYLNDFTVEAFYMVTKHWGATYRFKFIESLYDEDMYNLLGVSYSF